MRIKYILLSLFLCILFAFCLNQTSAKTIPGKYPEASMRLLTPTDLEKMSVWHLKIMRNEIFARHGYRFKTEDMRGYFKRQQWYQPRYDDVTASLTEIETANIKLIKQYEDKAGKERSSGKIADLIKRQKREIVFKTPWGSGPTELNHNIPQEASPEGPMSFVVDDSGRIFVLDQVNKRVQVYSSAGKHMKTIPLPGLTFSDIDIGPSGNLFLLDQWRHRAVLLIDDKGTVLKKVELAGKGITEMGCIWGMYSRHDGLWVECSGNLVRICDASGGVDPERPMVRGIFSRDGSSLLTARKIGDITAVVKRNRVGRSGTDTYTLYFDIPIFGMTVVGTDESGNIYLWVSLLEESIEKGPPYSIEDSHGIVVVLDKMGKEKRRIYMPEPTRAEEVVRSIRMTPDGTIYQLMLGEEGATMWRYPP
jgi:hypothetical protein